MDKTYEAVAPHDPALVLPRTVRSRIVKERGVILAREVPGPPNAETRVELLEHRDGLARYRLTPLTGRTHQLRLHLRRLGLPILGDRFYGTASGEPEDTALDDWTRPLQLLAPTRTCPTRPRASYGGSPAGARCRPGRTPLGRPGQQVSVSSKE